MSFNARTFIFDGVPCEEYGLMLYNFDSPSTRESNVGTNVDIIETRLNRGTKPIFYGTTMNEPLQFSMTFGSLEPMTKYEVDLVAGWLTGHSEYKWLEIIQDDLADVRYKCFINNLNEVSINGSPIAFTCDVICDSQFAYEYPQTYTYKIDGETTIDFFNRSSHNGYLYPKITISDIKSGNFSFLNITDDRRICTIDGIPAGITINMDCERQIITTDEVTEDDINTETLTNTAAVTIPKGRVRGDVNGDGIISTEDENLILNRFITPISDELSQRCADVNADRNVNNGDAKVIRYMLSGKYSIAHFWESVVNARENGIEMDDIEILGNWQPNPDCDTEKMQFYKDIEIEGIKTTSDVIIDMPSPTSITAKVLEDGKIRFWCVMPPINDISANILYGDGTGKVAVRSAPTNIYAVSNYKFPRLLKGLNKLKVTGNCTLTLQCEFLRKVGS